MTLQSSWSLRAALLAIFVTGVGGSPLAAQLGYSGSLQAASGSYIFPERTTSWYFSNGLNLRSGRFFASASIPIVLQNSSAVSYVTGVPIPTGGPENGKVREKRGGSGPGGPGGRGSDRVPLALSMAADSGDLVEVTPPGDYGIHVGDPYFGAGYDLFEGTGLVRSFSLEAQAKAPVATLESGVGTGAWDFGTGAALALGSGSTFVFANLGWWHLGDMPELELKDPLLFGLALGRSFGHGAWSLLASWSGSTPMIDGVEANHSIGLACNISIGEGRSLSAGLSRGLTESGSDFSAFAGVSVRLSR